MTDDKPRMPAGIWADRSDDNLPQYADTPFGIWWHDQRNGYTEYVRADLHEAERQRAERAEAALRELVAECTCPPAYSGRGLQDPECPAGLFGDIAREGLGMLPRCQYNLAALRQGEGGE